MPENKESNVYYRCYYHLFNAVTAQIKALEAQSAMLDLTAIAAALKTAQWETEEIFINAETP